MKQFAADQGLWTVEKALQFNASSVRRYIGRSTVGAEAREVEIPVSVAESLPFVHVERHVEPLASSRRPKRNVIGKLEEGSLHSDAVHTQSRID